MAARALCARNFDAVLRLPGSSSPASENVHGITPTLIAGILVRLTVWAGAAWWLAQQNGRNDLANTLALIIGRTWTLVAVLVAALALGAQLARRLMDCLRGVPGMRSEATATRNGAASRWDAQGAAAAGAYLLITLLVLLIAADLCDWPLTRSSALALWQFAQNLLIAGAALFIGLLGARWARDLGTPDAAATPEKRAGHYTALGVIAATTLLAVAVLLTSAGVLLGLAAIAVLGFLVWLVRGYLPDVIAGIQLRARGVKELWFEGVPWQVTEVGLLSTQVTHAGEFGRMQNRVALEARWQQAPAEVVPR
jgi:hypothetical protein